MVGSSATPSRKYMPSVPTMFGRVAAVIAENERAGAAAEVRAGANRQVEIINELTVLGLEVSDALREAFNHPARKRVEDGRLINRRKKHV